MKIIEGQHAYVIKFTDAECTNMNNENIRRALENDKVADVSSKLSDNSDIFQGDRMVAAKLLQKKVKKKLIRVHAESRLLSGPVENLLNKAPPAGCAIFFTHNSPCHEHCTKPNGPYNIVDRLGQFNSINNRAFVYRQVYDEKQIENCCPKERLKSIDDKMPLYRCTNNCIACFTAAGFNNDCLQ
ncbi:uncharacterized protein LOC134585374 isoform X2 [Pelobates fuscus]|uniref:uncharacterized protein LOC134585374 isoform X2 n=1 Tax=Pelobates fuscus TaxID=191477 RepID=UPI002FE48A38